MVERNIGGNIGVWIGGIIPGLLGNIAECAAMVGQRIGGVHVGGKARWEVAIQNIEVGASHSDVIGRGSETIHSHAQVGQVLGIRVVASGGAAVACRDHDRNALRRRLLPQILDELIARGAQCRFAFAEADIQDVRLVVVDGALDGEEKSRLQGGVGGGVKDHLGVGGDT